MQRALSFIAVFSLVLVGCLEDDPNYIPPDSSGESGSADTTADGTGTGTGTDTGTTDTGTTDTGTTDTGTTDTGTETTTETGPMCEDPLEDCGGDCVDTSMEKNHCGMCFMKCHPAQEQCVDGMCVPK